MCSKSFKTNYRYQVYCQEPCKHVTPKKTVVKAERRTNKQMSDRRKELREEERLHTILQRKYLTMKL